MFSNMTAEQIKKDTIDSLPASTNKNTGTFADGIIGACAFGIAEAYINLQMLSEIAFAETSYGEYLDMKVSEVGIRRREAVSAKGSVLVTASNGTTIPLDSAFSTTDGIVFTTDTGIVVGESGQAEVGVTAELPGSSGNVLSGRITNMAVQINGVTSISNPLETSGGYDEESDESLLERFYAKVRLPQTSGNANHYKLWALEVDGVGDVKVYPLWNGNGTVKVVIVDSNSDPAGAELVADVSAHIEENRPIGATVTVQSATLLSIDITADIQVSSDTTLGAVGVAFEKKLDDYKKEIVFKASYVSYATISSLLLNTEGVLDHSNLKLNGFADNVIIGDEEVPGFTQILSEVV